MTHELRIQRLIDAPVELVFDTFCDPDLHDTEGLEARDDRGA